jgi:hypothetical protein
MYSPIYASDLPGCLFLSCFTVEMSREFEISRFRVKYFVRLIHTDLTIIITSDGEKKL